jgi:hypothetical protein
VQSLDVTGLYLADDDAKASLLARVLQSLPQLTSLTADGAHLTGRNMATLAPALHHVPLLEVLRLARNRVCNSGFHYPFRDTAGAALAAALPALQRLRVLDLSDNELSDCMAAPLLAVLPQLAALERLDLSVNVELGRTAAGAQALAAAIACLPRLKDLSLAWLRHLGEVGWARIAAAIGQATQLEVRGITVICAVMSVYIRQTRLLLLRRPSISVPVSFLTLTCMQFYSTRCHDSAS